VGDGVHDVQGAGVHVVQGAADMTAGMQVGTHGWQ
jgi:hypothetical protein